MKFKLYEDNRIKSNRSFFPNNTENNTLIDDTPKEQPKSAPSKFLFPARLTCSFVSDDKMYKIQADCIYKSEYKAYLLETNRARYFINGKEASVENLIDLSYVSYYTIKALDDPNLMEYIATAGYVGFLPADKNFPKQSVYELTDIRAYDRDAGEVVQWAGEESSTDTFHIPVSSGSSDLHPFRDLLTPFAEAVNLLMSSVKENAAKYIDRFAEEEEPDKYYGIVCLDSIKFNTCWEVTIDNGLLDVNLLKQSNTFKSNEIPDVSNGIGDIPVAWYFYKTKDDAIRRPITASSGISYEGIPVALMGRKEDFTLTYEPDCEQWVLIMPKVDYYLDAGPEADLTEICSEIIKALTKTFILKA